MMPFAVVVEAPTHRIRLQDVLSTVVGVLRHVSQAREGWALDILCNQPDLLRSITRSHLSATSALRVAGFGFWRLMHCRPVQDNLEMSVAIQDPKMCDGLRLLQAKQGILTRVCLFGGR